MGSLQVSRSETSTSIAAIVASVADDDITPFRRQTSPDGQVTIAFTDIVGSTEQMEQMGEETWLTLMHTHGNLVRECVDGCDGEIVKSLGDGFMAAFASAAAAQDFAVKLQQALAGHNAAHPEATLNVRVGLHTGRAYAAFDDLLGRAVTLAARIAGSAGGGDILVSKTCRDYTAHLGRWSYGPAIALHLKGIATTECVYPLVWRTS